MKPERFSSGNGMQVQQHIAGQRASMKPERFSSGNSARPPGGSRRAGSFNEAGAFQLRKPSSRRPVLRRSHQLQ